MHSDTNDAKRELAAEVLRSEGRLRLQVTGWSMLPTIFPGDTLLIEHADSDKILQGEIVLCFRDRRFAVHRVVEKNADTILTRGDAMPQNDPPVANHELLGKVALIVRDGKRIQPRKKLTISDRAVAAAIRRSHFAARIRMALHTRRQRQTSQLSEAAQEKCTPTVSTGSETGSTPYFTIFSPQPVDSNKSRVQFPSNLMIPLDQGEGGGERITNQFLELGRADL
jgi:peptidase S24-like protein